MPGRSARARQSNSGRHRGVPIPPPRLPPISPDLPPGQAAVPGFPRFGSVWSPRLARAGDAPTIQVGGLVDRPFTVPWAEVTKLRRTQMTADFHCVAGWSARDVRWGGIPFRAFYDAIVRPRVRAGAEVSHLLLIGADGWKADLMLEDALGSEVLLADRLNGVPISEEHGAPLRFVSPAQYGYKNVKHLVRIELDDRQPNDLPGQLGPRLALLGVRAHPRGRVALEERHRYVPAWALRWTYRNVIYPMVVGLLSLQQALPGGRKSE